MNKKTNFFICLVAWVFGLPFAFSTNALAQSPELGSPTFYADVKSWMVANSRKILLGSYGPSNFVVFDASGYKLSTYKTANAGDTIDNAIAANPASEIILNGALFNYKDGAPMLTTGLVVNGGAIISNTSGTPSDRPAVLRYWFGQTNDASSTKNAGHALSYQYGGKGHPGPIGTGPNDIGAAMGGLLSLIWEQSGSPHMQTDVDDTDIRTYNAMKGGSIKAFGLVGINRQSGLLIVLAKPNWTNQSIYSVQQALFNSQTDRCLVVDGSSSVAFYVKSNGVIVRTSRHVASPQIPAKETVASYIVFSPL